MINFFPGGCGAMYDISIKSPEFKGLSIVKQHKLVTEVSCCSSFSIKETLSKKFIGNFYFRF